MGVANARAATAAPAAITTGTRIRADSLPHRRPPPAEPSARPPREVSSALRRGGGPLQFRRAHGRRHRGGRVPRLPPLRVPARPRPAGDLRRQPRHRHAAEHRADPGRDFVFLNHDMTENLEIDEPVDFVYHFAALASPVDYLRMPLHSLKVGSYGTHHALGLAKFKRARFLLASTSEVYGDPQVHPQPETYWGHVNPIGPRGVYDEAKRYAEALTMAYHNQQGLNTAHRPDLQHLRPADAPARRPGDPELHPPGARERAADRLRRRLADAELLLRRRPHPRARPPRRERRALPGEPRKPGRVHDPRARAGRPEGDGTRPARSSSRRCRSTTRRSDSRTSPARGRCSAGSRRSSSRTGSGECWEGRL